MKKRLISILLTAALCVSLSSAVLSAAAVELTDITIYRGVNIYVDGKLIMPVDANGNEVVPFVYNGTTYLPLRAISGIFGAGVSWDDGSRTVTVISGGAGVNIPYSDKPPTSAAAAAASAATDAKIVFDGAAFVPTDVSGNAVPVLIIGGTTYLPARAFANLFNTEVNWNGDSFSAYIGEVPAVTDPAVLKAQAQEFIAGIQNDLNEFEAFYAAIALAQPSYIEILGMYQDASKSAAGNLELLLILAARTQEITNILNNITKVINGTAPETFQKRLNECKANADGISVDSDLNALRTLRSDLTASLSLAKSTYNYCTAEMIEYYLSLISAS